jgi:Bacterial Ig domain
MRARSNILVKGTVVRKSTSDNKLQVRGIRALLAAVCAALAAGCGGGSSAGSGGNTGPDSTAPSVSIAAPAGGTALTGVVALAAAASDDVGVVGVQFRVDGVNVGAEDTSAPYQIQWNSAAMPNGSHTLSALARDAAGNSTLAQPVNVTVSNAATVQAWSFPGIPYPTDALPAGIMPALPTPDAAPGWPYDPCRLALPALADSSFAYIVSTTGNDASAGNAGRGTIAAPRRTIPEGNFPAGTTIFVIGANSPYGTIDFNMGDTSNMTFTCSAGQPCWWIGIDGPRIGRAVNINASSHLIIDGLKFNDIPGGGRPWGEILLSDSQYVTVRNVEIRGSGQNAPGGSLMRMSNVEYLMTYRTRIHDGGSWMTNATGLDVHGWRPLYGNRYLWLIDSDIFHIQGDSIQVGNSNNIANPQSASSHYVYIAGNRFHENYENALDNKNSYHVVFSSNEVHDFFNYNQTAIILSNNGEGPWTGYHWALNNRIWNTGTAIRDSGSEQGERNFAVGNAIWGASTALIQANNSANREAWFIANSVHGSTTAMQVSQPGTNASVFVRGNIFHNAGEVRTQSATYSVLERNLLFATTLAGSWDVNTGNLSADPLLASPATGDFTPGAASPAIGAALEDPVFALFTSLYGRDIRFDLNARARPAGSGWDIGAIEVP